MLAKSDKKENETYIDIVSIFLPAQLLTRKRLRLYALLPRTGSNDVSSDKTLQVLPGAILARLSLIRLRLAILVIVIGVLPGLARQTLDGRVAGRKNGDVLGRIVEVRFDGLEIASERGKDVDAAGLGKDVRDDRVAGVSALVVV